MYVYPNKPWHCVCWAAPAVLFHGDFGFGWRYVDIGLHKRGAAGCTTVGVSASQHVPRIRGKGMAVGRELVEAWA